MSNLTIYKASAGSGKTFRLVAEYIKLLLKSPFNYKHLLAVTFTNKATAEMKDRILKELYSLSIGNNKMMNDLLVKECGLSPVEINLNAKKALSLILHDYDRFAVNTIDSFFQRVLRSFARESGLYGLYEVDLDQDAVLSEACDRMLMSVETDSELRNWLLMMSENQLEEGKNWQIRDRIIELGKEIHKELFYQYQLKQGTLEDERLKLKHLNNQLVKIKKWFEAECNLLGKKGLLLMQQHKLTLDDFKYKGSSFANVFNKLNNFKGGELSLGTRFLNAPDNLEAWPSSKNNINQVAACFNDGMNNLVKTTIEFFEKNSEKYYTAAEIYKNIYALGVLSTLSVFTREVGQENNSLLISESDLLLKGIIGNNDTPFIYEKTGNDFHYFMMDEFQDTSVIQWENFKPLIINSLAENNPNLVVGDVKQSIYRWRESDWQLLESTIKDDLMKFGIKEENLNSNWRSRNNIIEFNNHFFEESSKELQAKFNENCSTALPNPNFGINTIVNVFKDVTQNNANNKEGGIIDLSFILSDNQKEYHQSTINLLIEKISYLQDNNIRASDIVILVRKNNQGNEIANALINHRKLNQIDKYNFEVISDDSLFLASSLSIQFLTRMFSYIIAPWDNIARYSIIYQFSEYILPSLSDKLSSKFNFESFSEQKNYKQDSLNNNIIENKFFPFFTEKDSVLLKQWSTLSIIDLERELEDRYLLNMLPGEQASLQAFQDIIIDFNRREGGNLHKFIEWWNQKGSGFKVQTSLDRDAIRIMSIHKSKGLEFPYVLIPFCDWKFEPDATKRNIVWCPTVNTDYSDFPFLPVNYSKILQKTTFNNYYFTEMLLSYIDNINLLYVAFTRAVDGLFIFSEANPKDNTVSSLFDTIFVQNTQQSILNQNSNLNFSCGELVNHIKKRIQKNEIILSGKEYNTKKITDSLKLHKNYQGYFEEGLGSKIGKMNEGKIFHELLSFINVKNDLIPAVNSMINQGKLDTSEKDEILAKMKLLLNNPKVQNWFDGNYRVLNEITILSPQYDLKRPDRVMIKDKTVIIVDYKTSGIVLDQHQSQVKDYMNKIKEMGFENIYGYVWYLTTNQILDCKNNFLN